MNVYFVRHSIVIIALLLLLGGCFLFGPREPLISWDNFDFGDGLGNLLTPMSRSFVGTPITSGAAIGDFFVRSDGNKKWIWGASIAVVRSDDGGATWDVIEDSMKHQLLDFEQPGRIRFDSSGCAWVMTRIAAFRSADDGASWNVVYRGLPGIQCVGYNDMEIDGSTVWMVSDAGTLTKIDTRTLLVTEIYRASSGISDLLLASDGRIFICTVEGILVSLDAGLSFSFYSDVEAARDLVEVGESFFCATGGNVVEIGPDGHVAWTLDNKADWISYLDAAGSCVYALSACTSGNYLVVIDTADGNSADIVELGGTSTAGDVYLDDDGILYVGLGGRVLVSADGGQTFEEHAFGISTVSVIESRYGQTWAGLVGSSAAYFDSSSAAWQSIGSRLSDGGLASSIYAFDISPTQTILASNSQQVAITYDGGQTFQYSRFSTEDETTGYGVTTFVRDSTGTLYMLTSKCWGIPNNWSLQVYRTTDDGITWSLMSEFCPLSNGGGCSGILVIDERRSCSWATVNVWNMEGAGLYRGTRECTDWVLLDALGLNYFADACLDSEGNLYIFGSGNLGFGIYRLDDEDTWSFIQPAIELTICPSDFKVDGDGCMWIASEVGLFFSPDGGASWIRFTKEDGLASDLVNSVAVEGEGEGKVVWVGTALGASRGVFTR